jgi:hypothetical protein
MISRESIIDAIEEVRQNNCGQGDLFISRDDPDWVEFLIGLRNSMVHKCIYPDFWYLVRNSEDDQAIIEAVLERAENEGDKDGHV